MAETSRIPILYLAPWVDIGGTDKNTIDWFRAIDRNRFAPSLITTQASPNRRLDEVTDFAEEVWVLPDLMPAEHMPKFILDFMYSRDVRAIHLMNSRLGYDLLPDIACLPDAPGVVVQLHVEEQDRSGYVRYVTTRYGNLVDRFSVSHEDLAKAVHDYGIPRDKVKVIYIGVDAEREFSPDHVEPVDGLTADRMHILFPARLVPQKDPLLMVDVAIALRDMAIDFQIHVLGEGELEAEVRRQMGEHDLVDRVLIHPPTATPQRWYAGCDAVLMTSVFEGVPAVVYEAMAMGLPVVAPALPGNVELLGEDYDGLVDQRDSVASYAEALARLAEDSDYQAEDGKRLRARAREYFSLERMAAEHGELYAELAGEGEVARASGNGNSSVASTELRFVERPIHGTPLVSVLVPHFNQAKFLGECIESIRAQNYPQLEVIVVDDASTEADAVRLLDELEAAGDATVVRLSENGGPSHARNMGIEHCSGRYILPMDSDNVLLPDAVERLVEQLSVAGEDVGFIYPNLQFFGNREDYYEMPEYNLYTLLHGNFCDTSSLLDREIFDAGERYREEIKVGHEDWEFALRLAARGVRGEAAQAPTIRYRKWGFNRSDVVDHSPRAFTEVLAEISPFKGREAAVKAGESPALSIVALAAFDLSGEQHRDLVDNYLEQRCTDAELVARFEGDWPDPDSRKRVRRIPPALAESPFDALRQGLLVARGAFVAVAGGTGGPLLADPAFVEKVLRRFDLAGEDLDAIVLADAGNEPHEPFQPICGREVLEKATPQAVIWRRTFERHLPQGLRADPGDPLASLARLLSGSGAQVEWRHTDDGELGKPGSPTGAWLPLPENAEIAADPQGLRPGAQPLVSDEDAYEVPRWEDTPTWVSPLSTIAIRYREEHGHGRIITSGPPPTGYVPEHHLGVLRSSSLEGTNRVIRTAEGYRAVQKGEWESLPEGAEEIGYAEVAHLPGLDALALATHRPTGQQVLVSLPDDPILPEVDLIEGLGCIDPFPLKPRTTPSEQRPDGLLGLVRAVDYGQRRHNYSIGSYPDGELLGELGGLADSDVQGSIPTWIVDGRLVTERHRPPARWSGLSMAARWVAEPIGWGALATRSRRARAVLRRSLVAARRFVRPTHAPLEPSGGPHGWLFERARPGLVPLVASYHPVTGDQLLTCSGEEAAHMGYQQPEVLGFMRRIAPLTGELEQQPLPIPWARRLGTEGRSR